MSDETAGMPRTRGVITILATCLLILSAGFVTTASAKEFQEGKIRFGLPPWPGVTVKSEVAAQLFETIGYETEQTNVGLSFVFNGLSNRELDVFVANWSPSQDEKIEPFLEDGSVVRIARNIDDAVLGLAVPRYVWDAGVRSVPDLDKYAEKFEHEIYGIESGSAMNERYNQAILDDVEGLGDWKVVASSTSGMLTAVERHTKRGEWIVFGGWKPHWMFAAHDLKFLEDPTDTGIAANKTKVYTVVPSGFEEFDPNATRFLKQFKVGSAIQSQWILEHGRKERDESEVAEEWIADNLDVVEQWLAGVKTRDGGSAVEAVRAAY